MRILIIALSGIGDALLFTPAATLIRKHFPNIKMDALVMFGGARELYEQTSLFDNVIYHDFLRSSLIKSLGVVSKLRGKYDASINVYPSNRLEYNVIQFLIGAKRRAAAKYLRQDLPQLGFLNNVRMLENDLLHNVDENIRLSEKLLGFSADDEPDIFLPLPEQAIELAGKYLKETGVGENDLVIGFHAGSAIFKNQIKRRWEPNKFAELARLLIAKHSAWILLFGGPDESGLKREIGTLSGSGRVLIPPTGSIIQSAALMKRCNVMVTNDSGMMHLASATKTPTVAIIGPTNTNYIHPWHTEYEIASLYLDCAPCFIYSPRPLTCIRSDMKFKCIKELTVEAVYANVIHLLSRIPAAKNRINA